MSNIIKKKYVRWKRIKTKKIVDRQKKENLIKEKKIENYSGDKYGHHDKEYSAL